MIIIGIGENMKLQQNDQLTLDNSLKIILGRKWLIICCLVVALLPVIVYNQLSPPLYKADTALLVKEDIPIVGPESSRGVPININNQIEVVKSRTMSEAVAASLPPAYINEAYPLPKDKTKDFNVTEYIAKQIRNRISVHAVPNTQIIRIGIDAYSPEAAKVIADLIADEFKKNKSENRKEETRYKKIDVEEQLADFKNKLDNAENNLKEFKEKNRFTDISRVAAEINRGRTEAAVDRNQNRIELDAAEKQLSAIENKLYIEHKNLEQIFDRRNIVDIQPLSRSLSELESALTVLKSKGYRDDHPQVVEYKRQIQQIRNVLKESTRGENIENVLARIRSLKEQKDELEIAIQAYWARENALKNIIEKYDSELSTLPEQEKQLAHLVRETEVNSRMYEILRQKNEEMKVTIEETAGNVEIIDPAKINNSPVKPRKALNLVVAIILGLAIGTGFAFLTEFSDNSIKSTSEVEQLTGLNVLGTVPQISDRIKKFILKHIAKKTGRKVSERIPNLVTVFIPKSPESEAFRTIRTKLQLMNIGSPLQTLLITSPNPKEGKSLITANLSIAFAQKMGQKTLLVDADVRRPTLHVLFDKKREPGLVNILSSINKLDNSGKLFNLDKGNRTAEKKYINGSEGYPKNKSVTNLEQTLKSINAIDHNNQKVKLLIKDTITSTYVKNLDLLSCGSIPEDPSIITGSNSMKKLILELRNFYDLIIIDTLPINIFPDAALLGTIVDGSILVTKAKRTSIEDLLEAKELLKKAQSEILGLIVNYINRNNGYTKYYYYYCSNINRKKAS